eukprot:TRINITY_DN1653_c0_g1_i2.p1 TRINITY_DN1653_c0_g1~~TRINITY_DN1653_c0_g1_i2.p1  ORF type:complete len:503 (+),score=78.13 TRINITY_DN1653_c0_g1_i2:44-1552(+)
MSANMHSVWGMTGKGTAFGGHAPPFDPRTGLNTTTAQLGSPAMATHDTVLHFHNFRSDSLNGRYPRDETPVKYSLRRPSSPATALFLNPPLSSRKLTPDFSQQNPRTNQVYAARTPGHFFTNKGYLNVAVGRTAPEMIEAYGGHGRTYDASRERLMMKNSTDFPQLKQETKEEKLARLLDVNITTSHYEQAPPSPAPAPVPTLAAAAPPPSPPPASKETVTPVPIQRTPQANISSGRITRHGLPRRRQALRDENLTSLTRIETPSFNRGTNASMRMDNSAKKDEKRDISVQIKKRKAEETLREVVALKEIDQNNAMGIANAPDLRAATITSATRVHRERKDGQIFYDNGCIYQGDVNEEGKRHGRGKMVYSDGNLIYEGEWRNDKREGIGSLYSNERGLIFSGNWHNDAYSGIGILYNFFFESDADEVDYRNFSTLGNRWERYEGHFKRGRKDGLGTLFLTKGQMYTGEFERDQVHGFGRFILNQTMELTGEWENNILVKLE